MRITTKGVYLTIEGKPVQISGVGTELATGYIGIRKMLLWNRETGQLVPTPRKNRDRLRIVGRAF